MKKLALGTALWGWGVDKKTSFDLLDVFYDNGERYIDTASNYPLNGFYEDRFASENIISDWIKSNNIRDLEIIYKLGALTNKNKPENDLSPSHIKNECKRATEKFNENSIIPMIHWDNREQSSDIIESIKQLKQETKNKIGFSGIRHPKSYSEALNELGYHSMDYYIETKVNISDSKIEHYKLMIDEYTRLFSYGISISGVKFNKKDYSKDSYIKLARDKSFHNMIMTKTLLKRIEDFKAKDKSIRSMYHIGIKISEMNNKLFGYIVAPRNTQQLQDILKFRNNLYCK